MLRSYASLKEFLAAVGEQQWTFQLDVRRMETYCKHSESPAQFVAYQKAVKAGLAQCLAEGGLFIVDMNESDSHYEELNEPDLHSFYHKDFIPSQLLELKSLLMPEVYNKILAGTEWEEANGVHHGFRVRPVDSDPCLGEGQDSSSEEERAHQRRTGQEVQGDSAC